ncbi:MAG: protein-L-isoaspartate(D-aspartate) O-methyltransferase [Ignavibacteriaceae bacterium]|nr:protein-L-isoaspartate(D-aspartate) O-methyltransferase [Ignavibacteriaceae bacterium]
MYKSERNELVENLIAKGIKDKKVLEAIRSVERHKFVPEIMRHHAYKDIALPIGFEQTISQPYTVALMTQALQVKPDHKVLEIGTGSGYQAALLEKLGARVYSIERNFELYNRTRKLLDNLGIRVYTKHGDGTIGWEEFAPFDRIIVTAGSPDVPSSLKKQLALDGKIVIPVGRKDSQALWIVTKTSENEFEIEKVPHFVFVPLIGKEGWNAQ